MSLPLPPNRTCGSPASGSPVGGSPGKGLMRVQERQRMHSRHFSVHQHSFGSERRINRGHSSLLSLYRHLNWFGRRRSVPFESTSLRSLRSTPVTELRCYYGRSDSCSRQLFGTWSMNSGSFSEQVSLSNAHSLPDHSVSKHLGIPAVALSRYPSAQLTFLSLRSGLRHSHAGSSMSPCRIEFVILRTGRSPPAALHHASLRRSCIWLRAGERLPGEDFHLSDYVRPSGARAAWLCLAEKEWLLMGLRPSFGLWPKSLRAKPGTRGEAPLV